MENASQMSIVLTGLNETFIGNRYLEVKKAIGQKTLMTRYVNISVKGMMGLLINPMLKLFIPKTIDMLLKKVATKMKEREAMFT